MYRSKINFSFLFLFFPATVSWFFSDCVYAVSSTSSKLSFTQNARTLETGYSNLIEKSLANACLSIVDSPDSLPCNPATIPLINKPDFGAEALVSNGFEALKNTQLLLSGNLNQEVADTLFKKNSEIQIEGNGDVHFRSPYLAGRYVPLTVKGFTIVRNEANPEVEIQAMQESGFTFQTGTKLFGNLYGGIQTRFLSRKYINQQFKLVDLATQDGANLLTPQQQNITYIEPGLYLPFESYLWSPRISFFVANLGFVTPYDPTLNQPPEAQLSFAVTPPMRWGRLDLDLDIKRLSIYDTQPTDMLHFGALYHFGSLYLSGGLDHFGASSGIFYTLEKINAGILYSTTKTTTTEESFYTQTVYVQIGWQI